MKRMALLAFLLLTACAINGATCVPKVKVRHEYFVGVRCGW